MDFLKHAILTAEVDGETVKTNILAAPLAIVLTKMLASGAYPRDWSVGAVAPVPKPKGDPGSKDDHRAIVVGQAMAKLFSLVMLHGRMGRRRGHACGGAGRVSPWAWDA